MKVILIKPTECVYSSVQRQLSVLCWKTLATVLKNLLCSFVRISSMLCPKWHLRHLGALVSHLNASSDLIHWGKVAHLHIYAFKVCQNRSSIFSNRSIFDFHPTERVAVDPWISEEWRMNEFMFSSFQWTIRTANPFYLMSLERFWKKEGQFWLCQLSRPTRGGARISLYLDKQA